MAPNDHSNVERHDDDDYDGRDDHPDYDYDMADVYTGHNTGTVDSPDGGGTWLDEGITGVLLIAGVALFLFPEPATSGLGIVLITAGVLLWLIDLAI